MMYHSSRLGSFELKDNEVLHFPSGLYGFEKETRFGLLPFDPNIESPLKWLQSLATAELAFVVTDPYMFRPDYNIQFEDEDRASIDAEPKDSVYILVIVKIPKDFTQMTANFVAPLVINTMTLKGRQFVLSRPDYGTRHFLLSEDVRCGKAAAPA
ncbi:MAG: flagellar assembly protein FliW [Nitrospinaceae bacterium]